MAQGCWSLERLLFWLQLVKRQAPAAVDHCAAELTLSAGDLHQTPSKTAYWCCLGLLVECGTPPSSAEDTCTFSCCSFLHDLSSCTVVPVTVALLPDKPVRDSLYGALLISPQWSGLISSHADWCQPGRVTRVTAWVRAPQIQSI
jgi:hypothetical protein